MFRPCKGLDCITNDKKFTHVQTFKTGQRQSRPLCLSTEDIKLAVTGCNEAFRKSFTETSDSRAFSLFDAPSSA